MSTLEYTIYGIKKSWRISRTFVFSGAFAALIANGVFANAAASIHAKVISGIMFFLWVVIFGTKAKSRFFDIKTAQSMRDRVELELGLMLVLATHAGIQMVGGLNSPYYPALLILLAFLVVYTRQWVGLALMGAAIGLEFVQVSLYAPSGTISQAILHSVFIALFSLINLIFTRTEVARMRHSALKRIEEAKCEMESDAKSFRLTSATATASNRGEEEERIARSTVSELRRSLFHHLNLLKSTMELHTCIIFWQNADSDKLRIVECVSDSEAIERRLYSPKEGIVGAVLQSGSPMMQKGLAPGHPSIVYYAEQMEITDFLGVPIVEGGGKRGVLCADRIGNQPFSPGEKEILLSSVESIVQNVANERIFVQLQKAKSEQGRLLKASESLSKALDVKDVVAAALDAAMTIVPYDIAAVTLVEDKKKQKIMQVRGEGTDDLNGLSFVASSGLVGSVCKTGHFLPYRGKFDASAQTVFTKKTQRCFEKMRSLLVLPMISADEVMGTLVIGAQSDNAFSDDVRATLQVVMNQLGTKVQNARMYQQLEELATTDGLTGLPNHRSFQNELSRQFAHAKRYGSEISVILCDVDKFKGVNDTYGHTVGDIVLKALGETLRRIVVRDTDMPARYGGEEFIIICGGTGTDGAVQLGERIRKDLESQTFSTEKGNLTCTISMGVASYPKHAVEKEVLVERADLALYAAKEGGRNQVRTWDKSMVK